MKCSGFSVFSGEEIEIEFDRTINTVDPVLGRPGDASTFLAPGFLDLQVNGFAGADYNSPGTYMEAIAASIRALHSTGVTRFFPTVITGQPDRMLAAIGNLVKAKETLPEGDAIEAFHIEGPHISPADGPRGAHPARWVRPPDIEEYRQWQNAASGYIRLVTLSPEWAGACKYIEHLTREGVVVSIGHTQATGEQVRDAVSAGATLSTHLGNATAPVRPREPNHLWAQLIEDRLAASFIADGFHLPDSFLHLALRAKGIERSILITDAVAPAMCSPGPYQLGEVEVELMPDDRVVLKGSTRLAGSSLRMDRAVTRISRVPGVNLREAITMATINPARVGRVPGCLRGLQPGERGDLVKFRATSDGLEILETYVGGNRVF